MEELLKKAEELAELMEKSMVSEFKLEQHMLRKSADGKSFVVKDEFAEAMAKSTKTLDEAGQTRLSKAVERILNAAGIETAEATLETTQEPEPLQKSGKDQAKDLIASVVKSSIAPDLEVLRKSVDALAAQGKDVTELRKKLDEANERISKVEAQPAGGRPEAPAGSALRIDPTIEKQDENDPMTGLRKDLGRLASIATNGKIRKDMEPEFKAAGKGALRQIVRFQTGR